MKVIALPGGAAMEFVYCPPGPFYMGSNSVDNPDEISGGASLSHGFWIAKTEVTQTQWQSVMGDNPSAIPGDELPVGNVSWNDCREFCKKAGFGLRLPTEAQWEYACRHGPRHSCIDLVLPDQKMWHAGNSGGEPHPVAQKEPNRRGLFDMLGNQLEWCSDWYAPYPKVSTSNPSGPATGTLRVARGGSWETPVQDCRDARRFPFPPDTRIPSIGFRPVIPAEEEFMFP
ncbi:MAG: formylglycine-generating enzyme family protein [Kiritimatiellae bacterium]|nr:formylglycine-generating enzyme family protein [Kiritimatiellia bacterium]